MKVLLHYLDWQNRWEPYVLNALSKFDLVVSHTEKTQELLDQSEDRDVLLSMWCNGAVGVWTQHFPEKRIVTYLRRFELWCDTMMSVVDFNYVDDMIWLNKYYLDTFVNATGNQASKIRHWIVPNGIDLDEWSIPQEKPDQHKIAFIASMKAVKNIPLAAQVLKSLPEEYHIHHIGLFTENFTGELMSYIHYLGLSDRWHWEGKIPREDVQGWLSDKAFLINPSINEGNPNCVLEAMSMGIKPIIHCWPGAREQFSSNCIFETVEEAVELIRQWEDPAFVGEQTPENLRKWVQDHFSLANFDILAGIINDVSSVRPTG